MELTDAEILSATVTPSLPGHTDGREKKTARSEKEPPPLKRYANLCLGLVVGLNTISSFSGSVEMVKY